MSVKSVTVNGNTYSTDGSSANDMVGANGLGYNTNLIPMLADIMTVINTVTGGSGTTDSSVTSLTIGSGSKVFTVSAGKSFAPGMTIKASSAANIANYMVLTVTAYSGTTLTATVTSFGGSGTKTDWQISLSNPLVGALFSRYPLSSGTTLYAADLNKVVEATGSFTLSFDANATLGAGWMVIVANMNTSTGGNITLTFNAAETCDALTSFVIYPGEVRLFTSNGTTLTSKWLKPFYMKLTAGLSFVMPPGYARLQLDGVGGGGGGGAGRRGAASTVRAGGAPGGAPARIQRIIGGIAAGTVITATVGAGGNGGTAPGADSTDGGDGTAGGNTAFGSYLTAYGGAAGKGGSTSQVSTSGSGALGVGTSNNAGTAQAGAGPSPNSNSGSTSAQDNLGEGGGGTKLSSAGGNTIYGGAGSSSCDVTSTPRTNSASSMYGVSAASQGGWINASNNIPGTAPNAGLNGTYAAGGGATGGTCSAVPTVGANGAAGATDNDMGNPGAGGGSTITTNSSAGGSGGFPGGPGGGSGACLNGNLGAAGGAGAAGQLLVWGVA